MKNQKGYVEIDILIPLSFLIGMIVSEFLIYHNPEARADWIRMLPCAIIGPFIFGTACMGMLLGISCLLRVPECIMNMIKDSNSEELIGPFVGSFAGIFGCGGTIYRWIKYIIIENYPAFGYNPNNVYAVVGINSMFLMPIMIIIGGIAGAITYCIINSTIKTIRVLFCKQ